MTQIAKRRGMKYLASVPNAARITPHPTIAGALIVAAPDRPPYLLLADGTTQTVDPHDVGNGLPVFAYLDRLIV